MELRYMRILLCVHIPYSTTDLIKLLDKHVRWLMTFCHPIHEIISCHFAFFYPQWRITQNSKNIYVTYLLSFTVYRRIFCLWQWQQTSTITCGLCLVLGYQQPFKVLLCVHDWFSSMREAQRSNKRRDIAALLCFPIYSQPLIKP